MKYGNMVLKYNSELKNSFITEKIIRYFNVRKRIYRLRNDPMRYMYFYNKLFEPGFKTMSSR